MNDHVKPVGGFSIERTSVGGAVVLSPSGSLTFEYCGEVKTALESAWDGRAHAIVLDCRAIVYMDSAALELLVEFHDKVSAGRGEFSLMHLNDVCSDTLTASRLVHTLVVRDGLNQAIKGGSQP